MVRAGKEVKFSSFLASLSALAESLLKLLILEARQAAVSLIFMLAFGLAAALLAVTAWLALVACVVVALVEGEYVGWPGALVIAAMLSLAGGAGLIVLLIRRSKDLLFQATRRQLSGADAVPCRKDGYGNTV